MNEKLDRELATLARLYGVKTSFQDVFGQLRHTPAESTLAILKGLGAPVEKPGDVTGALRERRLDLGRRFCEPVVAAWEDELTEMVLRIPCHLTPSDLKVGLVTEGGESRTWEEGSDTLPSLGLDEVEGERYSVVKFPLPVDLPLGYHRLQFEIGDITARSLVLSAPGLTHAGKSGFDGRVWGVFLPLYSLYSERSWGAGDLGDLGDLLDHVSDLGGSFVGTLPLLSSFHGRGEQPGPYSPVSRLFWNELYLDITRIPDMAESGNAASLVDSPGFSGDLARLRGSDYVDYDGVMDLKRRVLRELAGHFFSASAGGGGGDSRRSDFEEFRSSQKGVEDYARFMAMNEEGKGPWPEWPDPQRSGRLADGDYDEDAFRYHLYVQWQLAGQLAAVSERGGDRDSCLYLDYPVGVPYDSFDAWYFRDLFLPEFSVGAPPDTFFRRGQKWGFPPVHPWKARAEGYRYFIDTLRNHLQYAGMLRLDHIMALHRLYWIPEGFEADQGAYVLNRAKELYAVLVLEAHRSGAEFIGEDLGTVPRAVRAGMKKRGVGRMYVLQSELRVDSSRAAGTVDNDCLASLNTHDMPLFAAFWRDEDTQLLQSFGHLDEHAAGKINAERGDRRNALLTYLENEGWLKKGDLELPAITDASHRLLAASDAAMVMVNLEDLWQEDRPQNVPGTTRENPNWRRKSVYSLEDITRSKKVGTRLREIDRIRRGH